MTSSPLSVAQTEPAQTWVYWIYGEGMTPLYVGVSSDVDRRLRQHAEKAWWVEVRRIDSRPYLSREAANEAEAGEIKRPQRSWQPATKGCDPDRERGRQKAPGIDSSSGRLHGVEHQDDPPLHRAGGPGGLPCRASGDSCRPRPSGRARPADTDDGLDVSDQLGGWIELPENAQPPQCYLSRGEHVIRVAALVGPGVGTGHPESPHPPR